MKKFLSNIVLLSIIVAFIATGFPISKYIMAHKFKWQIPEGTTLFMGASHIEHGIDDSSFEKAKNVSMAGERYLYTYLKLKKILDDGNKIERIILQCAPTDLFSNADYRIFDANNNNATKFIPLYYPYFGKEEWDLFSNYGLDIIDIIKIIFSRLYDNWALSSKKYFSNYGSFRVLTNIFDSKSKKLIEDNIEINYYGNKVNYFYLNKIIELCRLNDIDLIFLYVTMYKPELYYNQEDFYHALEMNFNDIEFWDYSRLDMPDEYRADPHHLNGLGAKYFTKIIAERLLIFEKDKKSKK